MIRGRTAWSVALRHADGSVVGEVGQVPEPTGWRQLPVLRGIATLGSQLRLGWRLLMLSHAVAAYGERRPVPRAMLAVAWVSAIVIGSLLFVALPLLATPRTGDEDLLFRLGEGALKLLLLGGYVVVITRLTAFRRLFMYHGAEHMAVHAIEAGAPLTVDSVAGFHPAHPRCGTAFLLILAVVDGLVLAVLPRFGIVPDLAVRLFALPIFVGVAYEVLRFGAHRRGIANLLNRIGVLSQRLTTAYPDRGQMEVAIAALQLCMAAEGHALPMGSVPVAVTSVPEPLVPPIPLSAPGS
jgi:uncharacterized protein YqhQ